MKKRWTNQKITAEIISMQERGISLNAGSVFQTHKKLYFAATSNQYFGSWDMALRSAGLDPEKIRIRRLSKRSPRTCKWSPGAVIAQIILLSGDKVPLDDQSVRKSNRALHTAGIRRFGSWKDAICAADIDYDQQIGKRPGQNKDELIRRIQQFASQGTLLAPRSVRKELGTSDIALAIQLFGSWECAVEVAGYSPVQVRKRWTSGSVISAIHYRHLAGLPLTTRSVWRDDISLGKV